MLLKGVKFWMRHLEFLLLKGPLFRFLSGQLHVGPIYSNGLLSGKPCICNKKGELRKCPSFTKPGSEGFVY